MSVVVMRRVVDPIEAGEIPEVLREALAAWWPKMGLDGVSYVRSSSNHVFRVQRADDEVVYLRLTPDEQRTVDEVAAEIEVLQRLRTSIGPRIVVPVPTRSGDGVATIDVVEGGYTAAVFGGVPGRQWVDPDDMTATMASEWAGLLAGLHVAGDDIADRDAGLAETNDVLGGHLVMGDEVVEQALEQGLAWLAGLPVDDVGWIHGDFQLDNLVWRSDHPIAIDFEDAGRGRRVGDVAKALADVWASHPLVCDRFLAEYESHRPLPSDHRDQIVRHLCLQTASDYALLRAAYADVDLDDDDTPEWVTEMAGRHQSWFATARSQLATPFHW